METLDFVAQVAALGIGATLVMDAVARLQKRIRKVPQLDYRLLGRWLLWMLRGRFRHQTIVQTVPQPGEKPLGWALHYGIGIVFAAVLLAACGETWLDRPTPGPALAIGILSLTAPFLVMQPAFGFGLAASKTPAPWIARGRSAVAHVSYGVGLYLSGVALHLIR